MPFTFTKFTKVTQQQQDIDEAYEVIFAMYMPRIIVDGKVVRSGNGKPMYDIDRVHVALRYIGVDSVTDAVHDPEDGSMVAKVEGQPVLNYFQNNPADWLTIRGIFEKIGKSAGILPATVTPE